MTNNRNCDWKYGSQVATLPVRRAYQKRIGSMNWSLLRLHRSPEKRAFAGSLRHKATLSTLKDAEDKFWLVFLCE
jgi:hypothetical protein